MTFMQIVARVLIYGFGWGLTATTLLTAFDWADPRHKELNRFPAVLLASALWALILGIIYW